MTPFMSADSARWSAGQSSLHRSRYRLSRSL